MSKQLRDPFDVSAYLPKSAHGHPATDSHSLDNEGEGPLAIRAEDGARGTVCFQGRVLRNRWHIRQYIFGQPAYDRACSTGSGARNPKIT